MERLDFSCRLQKLDVPEGLSPTDAEKRGWFINPMGDDLPVWAAFAAVIPALLVFILIFMETEITRYSWFRFIYTARKRTRKRMVSLIFVAAQREH